VRIIQCAIQARSLQKPLFIVGYEVLTAVVMKSTIFWDITPCDPLKVNRHFWTPLFRASWTPVLVSYWFAPWSCERPAVSLCTTATGNWGPLFHFPNASYIIRNFRPADYSACHLLSRWYLSRLFRSSRWRRNVPAKRPFTFNGLHGVISQKRTLPLLTDYSFAHWS
jgi:hypothetical protein